MDIIKDIYTDSMTSYITTDSPSQPVYVNRGVKQGCPLNGLLFNNVMDFVPIFAVPNFGNHSILAYADDLILIAEEVNDLQTSLNILDQAIQAIGLK